VIFGEGDLVRIDRFVSDHLNSYGVFHAHANNCFAITPHCIDAVGLFDENFYPAYLEDVDFNRRCELAGVNRCDIPNLNILHGDPPDARGTHGSRTINSDPILARENGRTHANNFDYYQEKWGGMPGQETLRLPYGAYPLSYWRFNLARQQKQQWRSKDAINN
jgi:GT2 family glycosyltransferase